MNNGVLARASGDEVRVLVSEIYGNSFHFAGSYYSFKDPETGESVLREGFKPRRSTRGSVTRTSSA